MRGFGVDSADGCSRPTSLREAALRKGQRGVPTRPYSGSLIAPDRTAMPNVVDCLESAWGGAAPLESSRGRRPVKQRHLPRVGDAAALVVDEAMIDRAPRRDQPTDRQLRIADHVGDLKLGSGLGDVEIRAGEQLLQPVADTERQSSDRRDNLEPIVLHVGPQRLGQAPAGAVWCRSPRLTRGSRRSRREVVCTVSLSVQVATAFRRARDSPAPTVAYAANLRKGRDDCRGRGRVRHQGLHGRVLDRGRIFHWTAGDHDANLPLSTILP